MNGTWNDIWGKTIIDGLISQGVTYFCLSPGLRCTPLTLAIAENKEAEVFVHFDERGSGFHALGYAKATKKPAALITTSGSAVGNLMPSVMEAFSDHIPLILLTADRPLVLQDTMANQACDQIKIFGSYVRYFFDCPEPGEHMPGNFLRRAIARAVAQSKYPIAGPVQINCRFSEPLFSTSSSMATQSKQIEYFYPEITLESPKKWADAMQGIEKGVIILGKGANAPTAQKLAMKLGWPILADLLSSFREKPCKESISHYHYIVKFLSNQLIPEVILHMGNSCISKPVIEWMKKGSRLIHVSRHSISFDPMHCVTDQIICTPEKFCEQIDPFLEKKQSGWLPHWKKLEKIAKDAIDFPSYSEHGLIQFLKETISETSALFFGNSMPCRYGDLLFFPKYSCGPIFANRGLSGIDGNIATIAGIAQTMPITAVIGDQTALYDINSLAQLSKVKHPVRLYIINNGGGGIFSIVSVKEKKEYIDTYFAAEHDRSFAMAASMFDLSYTHAKNAQDFKAGSTVIEITTNRYENAMLHEQIDHQVKEALESVFEVIWS